MGSYSPERKAAVIARMLPPHSQSIYQISRLEGIPANTLYGWRSHAGIPTQSAASESKLHLEWSQDARFAVIAKRLNFDYTIWTENKLSVSQPISLFLLFACAHCPIPTRNATK